MAETRPGAWQALRKCPEVKEMLLVGSLRARRLHPRHPSTARDGENQAPRRAGPSPGEWSQCGEVEFACWGVWAGPEQSSSAHFLGHGQAGLSPIRLDTPPDQRREARGIAKRECSEGIPSQMRGSGYSAPKFMWELCGCPDEGWRDLQEGDTTL